MLSNSREKLQLSPFNNNTNGVKPVTKTSNTTKQRFTMLEDAMVSEDADRIVLRYT